MKKNVKVSISGIQNNDNEETVEVVSVGEMMQRDDHICVSYEEAADNAAGVDCQLVKSMLKVKPDQIEIIKKGAAQTHMVFIEDRDTISYYSTPFGELEVAIHTDRLERKERDNGFQILLEYALEINASHMSNCNVDIRVDYLS
ncbi:MAG: DUF1934 domain-containing protein [Eubacterium sp.]|jgi:Uncharacterized protein conserved in bacteria|nr:DUF1934 domain-containing protein [Eubacterium sp.]MCI9411869.1 DUF1934 domain-containing protein [Eubacterium sp.]